MNVNEELKHFLDCSPTCFHAISYFRNVLNENGYTELQENEEWQLREGKYFVVRNESSVIAFRIPDTCFSGFMIGASHSDSPAFKIKENPEIKKEGYVVLNIEKYGGMLCAPWFDRPLSVAGRVVVKNGRRFDSVLVNVDRDLLMIPSLAIHMNRKVNEENAYNVQKDMLPILSLNQDASILDVVAETCGIDAGSICGHDLFLYNRQNASIWGLQNEFISAPHLDDLQCGFADLYGFLGAEKSASVPVFAVFDNEEVGSLTKQGANSTFLEDVLKRIAEGCGVDYRKCVASSFMVSADNAHAVHPNYADKADPVNRPHINEGIVIKYSANQKYTTDAVSMAIFKEVCSRANVPTQTFTNRSDMLGGSTLGNLSNSHVSLNTVDIGLPQLAMHSPCETAGVRDTEYLIDAMRTFYSSSLSIKGPGSFELI